MACRTEGKYKRQGSVDTPSRKIKTDEGEGVFVSVCETKQEHVRGCIIPGFISTVIQDTKQLSEGLSSPLFSSFPCPSAPPSVCY